MLVSKQLSIFLKHAAPFIFFIIFMDSLISNMKKCMTLWMDAFPSSFPPPPSHRGKPTKCKALHWIKAGIHKFSCQLLMITFLVRMTYWKSCFDFKVCFFCSSASTALTKIFTLSHEVLWKPPQIPTAPFVH